ncbi:MAG: class I SAM-dependent methyltransferase [Armatimonadota bacterium]|nr:class I SAM-dependent methyltransferase [Armatimonadota bacterium]
MTDFRPPTDWEAVYAANFEAYTFGEEPSQLAQTALRFWQAFGGNAAQAMALDLGSGEGRDTAFLAGAGLRVVTCEVAPTGLEKTRRLLAQRDIPTERVEMTLSDVRDFDYPERTCDLALAANVYQFLSPDEAPAHIRRLAATLKPGGICAVGVFHPAMRDWGVNLEGHYTATADDLMAFFPDEDGWLLLDRTEYWTYRIPDAVRMSFAYIVARK